MPRAIAATNAVPYAESVCIISLERLNVGAQNKGAFIEHGFDGIHKSRFEVLNLTLKVNERNIVNHSRGCSGCLLEVAQERYTRACRLGHASSRTPML
jgi:hypothetical protein